MKSLMKSKLSWLIFIIMLMIMKPNVNAQFKSDTLVLSFQKSSTNYSSDDGYGFSISGSLKEQNLRIKYADSTEFASPTYNDAHWKLDSSYKVIPAVGKSVYWYRFKINVSKDYVNYPMVMLFEGSGALELYVAGELKAKMGVLPSANDSNARYNYLNIHPVILSFPDSGTYQMAVRYKSDLNAESLYNSKFHVGVEDAKSYFRKLRALNLINIILPIGVGSVFFTLFLLHFLFFIFYKKEIANLFFAIFTLSIAVVMFALYFLYNAESMAYDELCMLIVNYIPIVSCFSLSAFSAFIFSKRKIAFKIITVISAMSLIIALLDSYAIIDFSYIIIWTLLLLSVLYTIVMMVRSIMLKQPGSLVLGSGVVFFFVFLIFLLIYGIVNKGITFDKVLSALSLIAIFSIPISISAYLAWRFASVNKNLGKQLRNVELLSIEKQEILQTQNETLELQVSERTSELQQEKKKSDDLLLNVLPQEIAEELKATGKSKAQLFDNVSVMFTDFVNFTQISERLGADGLLEELNINFTAFDRIMELYGLEKIKTIGDAYLAVSGLPTANEHHARNAVLAALDIIKFVQKRRTEVDHGLDIRIGINSGSLIAGIIGLKKFAYDIWGDTVNIAARMEQSGAPGKVNISETTYTLVKEEFDCIHRGKIDAKHKGEMDMYFVNNIAKN